MELISFHGTYNTVQSSMCLITVWIDGHSLSLSIPLEWKLSATKIVYSNEVRLFIVTAPANDRFRLLQVLFLNNGESQGIHGVCTIGTSGILSFSVHLNNLLQSKLQQCKQFVLVCSSLLDSTNVYKAVSAYIVLWSPPCNFHNEASGIKWFLCAL